MSETKIKNPKSKISNLESKEEESKNHAKEGERAPGQQQQQQQQQQQSSRSWSTFCWWYSRSNLDPPPKYHDHDSWPYRYPTDITKSMVQNAKKVWGFTVESSTSWMILDVEVASPTF